LITESKVGVFFYGSYMNLDVLKEVDIVPNQWEVAKVSGFDIIIQPHANLVVSERHCVFGILATVWYGGKRVQSMERLRSSGTAPSCD
jgi:hypothetical protein